MSPPFVSVDDRALRRAIAQWPSPGLSADVHRLLARAEYHGLGGILSDALSLDGAARVERDVAMRELARELDHRAHLAQMCTIDDSLAAVGVVAVALKGVCFGERFYPRPAARVTGDTDLLVREVDLDTVTRALVRIGYVEMDGKEEKRYRREHHHICLFSAQALPLELHFHAYRGFGRTLWSEPLIERSSYFRDFRAIRVMAPDDEVVYLAIHAAAHKFGRWSWLFDLRLLIETLDEGTLADAGRRARELGYERPVALAARLLVSIMGMDATRLAPLGELGRLRGALVEQLLSTPKHPVPRALSRLAYTTALCSDTATSVRWVAREMARRSRDQLCRLPFLRAVG